MIPASYNFTIVRGTSGPTQGLIFQLQAGDPPVPVPYEDVRLSIYDKKGKEKIMRPTLSNGQIVLVDAPTNRFAWVPTTVDTRKIPLGEAKAYYELEVWNGGNEIVYMLGFITGIANVNDDIDGTNSDGDS